MKLRAVLLLFFAAVAFAQKAQADFSDPLFGPNVHVYKPTDNMDSIHADVERIHERLFKQDFSRERYALLFMPGDYREAGLLHIPFYVHVAGLGRTPLEVQVSNIHTPPHLPNGNCTCTFWRSVENLSVIGQATYDEEETFKWSVSQAAPIRRQLLRLGDTPFSCTEADIDIRLSADYFIPASILADWRRQLTDELISSTTSAAAHKGAEPSSLPTDTPAQPAPLPAGSGPEENPPSLPGGNAAEEAALPPLMTCRYCLRHALGQCLREHPTLRGALTLRLADGRRFPLHFDCQRCEMHVLRTLLVCIAFLFGFHAEPLCAAQSERPYSVGYNFRVHADSLLLQEDRPMHWCQATTTSSLPPSPSSPRTAWTACG